MPNLIKDGAIVTDDDWAFADDQSQLTDIYASADRIFVNYTTWLEAGEQLDTGKEWGVVLNSDQSTESIGPDLYKLSAVALHFETFMDGRSFSQARELREKYGFEGEIRAVGSFMLDQLFYLSRCGVNAFQFGSKTNLNDALNSLSDFSDGYQASVDQAEPLFRRR